MALQPLTSLVTATLPQAAEFTLDRDRANQIWSDLSATFGYRSLEVGEDDSFLRAYTGSEVNGLLIEPPFVQHGMLANHGAPTDTETIAQETEKVFGHVAQLVGIEQYADLRARQIYEAPVSDRPGAARILIDSGLLGLADGEPESIHGADGWTTLRFTIPADNGDFSITLEPRHYGEMTALYVEADAGFVGDISAAEFGERIRTVRQHVEGPFAAFVDRLTGTGTSGGTSAPAAAEQPPATEEPPAEAEAEAEAPAAQEPAADGGDGEPAEATPDAG